MSKKYTVFAVTRGDIEDAISATQKAIKLENDSTKKKSFLQMQKAVRENPRLHYKKMMIEVMKELEPLRYSLNGRFINAVQTYMVQQSNGKRDTNHS